MSASGHARVSGTGGTGQADSSSSGFAVVPRSPSLLRMDYNTPDHSLPSITMTQRPLRAAEVYAAGKAELNGHAPLPLVKPRVMSADAHIVGPLAAKRASASGAFYQAVPPTSGLLSRGQSFTRQRDGSFSSILSHRDDASEKPSVPECPPPAGLPSPTFKRSCVSAPSSQLAPLQNSLPWQPALSQVTASPAASPRFDSRSYSILLASKLGDSASSNSSNSSAAHTPRDSLAMKPRPPAPGDPASHRPRRPSFTNLSPESSKHCSPQATGVLECDPAPCSRPQSVSGIRDSTSNTPLSCSLTRPSSSRQRGIDALVDAIRSKSDARLQEAIAAFRQQHGSYKGLNERHSLTGKTALHEAVLVNNIPMAKLLLKAGADPNVGHEATGPPLIDAAAHGETGMVELLLGYAASVTVTDKNGWTPLHHACQVGHVSTAHVLIARGADLYACTLEEQTALELAPVDTQHELVLSAAAARAASSSNSPSMHRSTSRPGSGIPPSPARAAMRLPGPASSPLGLAHGASQRSSAAATPSEGRGGTPSRPTSARLLTHQALAQHSGAHPQQELPMAVVNARLLALRTTCSPPHSSSLASDLQQTSLKTNESLKSAVSSDMDEKQSQSPPPQLELPDRVFKRISSQGAGPADIAEALEQEDAEMIRRQQRAMTIIFGHQRPIRGEDAAGGAPDPGALAFKLLAACVPVAPRFGFGCNVAPRDAGADADADAGADSARQPQGEEGLATSNGSAIGSAITAAAACAPQSSGRAPSSGSLLDSVPTPSGSAAAAAGSHAGPPELVRDSSPVRSRRASEPEAGDVRASGGGSGRRDRDRERRHNPLLISQAALALAGTAGLRSSIEVMQARAVQMFNRSSDVQTGSLAWTRGELIGAGAFGKVYAGLNQMTGELMAVKVLELLKGQNMLAQLQELQKELSICKTLEHKHIVGYIDSHFDEKDSTLLIFLEYVPGGSISSMLGRFGKFKEELVRKYTRQLLLGLEYLHSRSIIHRDLKGGNVLVTRDGNIKLTDFGASKVNQETTLNDGAKSLKGSPFWMAPEVIEQAGYGRRADIWSLGCTVIEMLTGKHPWPDIKADNPWSAMMQIIKMKASGPPRPAHCSDLAVDFLDRCFKLDPNERPTAAQLLEHEFVCLAAAGAGCVPQRSPSFEFSDTKRAP